MYKLCPQLNNIFVCLPYSWCWPKAPEHSRSGISLLIFLNINLSPNIFKELPLFQRTITCTLYKDYSEKFYKAITKTYITDCIQTGNWCSIQCLVKPSSSILSLSNFLKLPEAWKVSTKNYLKINTSNITGNIKYCYYLYSDNCRKVLLLVMQVHCWLTQTQLEEQQILATSHPHV